ncbi:hypothetical protein NHX12_006562 [Muraenolepis orangiensis]|uniref:Nuclear condensin complex subunit 3 C-terminal domain-containing protein n=1 Tax=Muraenolepis orangiensis TaxID=630683 RepID=A0A9Q0DTK4_9TELE|nr:hypothetical protein NHX12_006562 [Muraenolepis orangiensis]
MPVDPEMDIKETFNRAQKGHHNKAKLVAGLTALYDKLEDKTLFHEEFIHYLKYAMIVYKREPASHMVSSHAVRFRVCQLINKLLGSMVENAQIDDDLFDSIHRAMLVRITDKFPNVRIQAALAMTRLQQPKDQDCLTISAYMLILENDANAEVRRAVLSCIAMSPHTLPKVLKRTRDIKEAVRKLAYQVLADKVHIKALSIAQRVNLLQQGLHDSSEAVRETVRSRLLPSWLQQLDGDVVELLHRLDVENCSQMALDVLAAIFSNMPEDQLLQDTRVPLDPSGLIPGDSLSCENVLYWRALCEFVRAKGEEGEDMLDKILPDAATYAHYLSGFVKSVPVLSEEQRADFNTLELVMTKEKRVVAALQEMLCLPQTPPSLVSLLTEKLLNLVPDDNRCILTVTEIMSDVREPITAPQPMDENEKRRQQIKLAEVKVRILEAKQSLEDCIAAQEFSHAAQLKDSITELENQYNLLLQDKNSQPADQEIFTEKSDPDTLLRCLTMCAELLKQMNMKTRVGPTISDIMSSLVLPCIASAHPAVRNMAVLCLGTCALHSKELAKAHMVLLLQIAQLDSMKIRISALRSIIDLLLLYGFQLLSEKPVTQEVLASHSPCGQEEEGPSEEKGDLPGDMAQSILVLLSEFLDSEVSDLRTETAEGLAKLMYNGRISSAKMFSRLVLLWYNPVTEDDTRLRHCLGVFFQLYARENRAHQEVIAECFLPTIRTLMNAPGTSPLAEVEPSNVVELLVELTRPGTLIKPPQAHQESCVHDSMAMRVCGEILKDHTAPEVRLYARTLGNLQISANQVTRAELHALLQEITQVVKDRVCLGAVEKVMDRLVDSKEAERRNETALQPLDIVADGQKKATTAKGSRKASRRMVSSEESDGENVPEPVSVARPSRRAKTAALEKTRLDLNPLIDQEANTS